MVFGGLCTDAKVPGGLRLLDDVWLFDLETQRWLAFKDHRMSPRSPGGRYGHLASITADQLFVIGGQSLDNTWVDQVNVFHIPSDEWVIRRDYHRHCSTHRSLAVTAEKHLHTPRRPHRISASGEPQASAAILDNSLVHLPYSADPTDDAPCDIFLYNNFNVSA